MRRDLAILLFASLALLAPFLAKPAHVDDPLFIWTARQVTAHPLDFYGFNVNWADHSEPMPNLMINPPLLGYWLAGAAALLGWSEIALHAAVLPLAVLSVIGVYFIARHYCRHPLLAALLMLVCPAFLVSATTLMCDVPMLCLWIWAVVFWIRGSTGRMGWLPVAGILLGLATLTKYSAVCLLPLLFAHAMLLPQPLRTRIAQYLSLLVPVTMILAYNHYTAARYGRPLFLDAIGYSSAVTRSGGSAFLSAKLLDGLIFVGGGALIAGVLGFVAASHRVQAFILAVTPVLIWMSGGLLSPRLDWKANWTFNAQAGFLAGAGLGIVLVSVDDWFKSSRDERKGSLFLLLWTTGAFVFADHLNWVINARSILPLLPPVCIFTARALQRREPVQSLRAHVLAGCTAAMVAILACIADYQSAAGDKWAAEQIMRKYPHRPVWFAGHWGFQYYMQLAGAKPLEDIAPACKPGDVVVIAMNNYGLTPPTIGILPLDALRAADSPFLSIQSKELGAGFYFSGGDRLPFRFGNIPADQYFIFQVMGDGQSRGKPSTTPSTN